MHKIEPELPEIDLTEVEPEFPEINLVEVEHELPEIHLSKVDTYKLPCYNHFLAPTVFNI